MTTGGASPGPVARPVMAQRWDSLTFVHWRYDARDVQRLLPAGLSVDTFDGSAWVGLVPFQMKGIRPPGVRPLPWIGTFPETNIRTYVTGPDGRRGVYFSSLDITRSAAVAVARMWYRLPYCWAEMMIQRSSRQITYVSRRRWPREVARSAVSADIGDPIGPDDVSDLEHFLTARWGLWTRLRSELAFAPVDHVPWPLHRAALEALDQDLTKAAGLPEPVGDPLVHFSPGVDVTIGRPERMTHA